MSASSSSSGTAATSTKRMYDVIVVGGGAAGMTAAIAAAENGAEVLLLEKNDRMGKKLAITGKGRCNVTNNCDLNTIMENIPNNGRFLYSALSRCLPSDTMAFFESMGVPLKTERGRRVFPVSDRASDIVSALVKRLEQLGVQTARENVRSLILEDGRCAGVNTHNRQIRAKTVILATGGASYPKTGSDGFGYRLAEQAGHSIITPRPSLSALVTEEKWVRRAAGLTLKNAAVRLICSEKTLYEDFGELMFTADGIGGATVLSASAHIPEMSPKRCIIVIDLKPALSEKQLDVRILRDFAELRGGTLSQSLRKLLPKELVEPISELTNILLDKKIGEINKTERKTLVKTLKFLTLHITGFRPLEEAIVTRGGVCVGEISPKTLESRLCKALYFAGELIDVDAYTGGFNLQIAFATGRLAGVSAANS
ncbi:MAG: NAD(P)/FAD-dependent oxidoreductase [Lachnospiraceae bacterium]|nr:NAD(P)/FAD-dependent oxidoreductase [Ruminococcus sp.]MCM1276085.1 NAD(P)/FAD-dependent oxidoreductase [Lachnospiraceae bacterium]